MSRSNKNVRFSFHREYKQYTGGHQKFRDYLEHTAALPNVECHLYANSSCRIMSSLFTSVSGVVLQQQYQPEVADVVFLAGVDWKAYLPKKREGQKVVNLIQHVRHGDPAHPLFQFLKQEALRICVSEEVRQAILPYANGECVTVTMGHSIPDVISEKNLDLYILGKKNPLFARSIQQWAENSGLTVHADLGLVERSTVFNNLARANVALVLPNPTEGFFLPGIEAMALSERVVVPDCVGNRGYCKQNLNIDLCEYEVSACIETIVHALERVHLPVHRFEKFRGKREARSYNMTAERNEYQRVLSDKVLSSFFG